MKTLLVVLLLMFSPIAFGQEATPFPTVDGKINYSEVTQVPAASKDELYSRAKLWFANAFVSSNHVIQLDDRTNGVIIGKGTSVRRDRDGTQTWEFTVKIQLKEERYKAEIYDIYYKFENDLSRVSPAVRAILQPESVTYFSIDERYADRSSRKSMYDKKGNLKKGLPTNLPTWANEKFALLLASIRKQLSEGVAVDDF